MFHFLFVKTNRMNRHSILLPALSHTGEAPALLNYVGLLHG